MTWRFGWSPQLPAYLCFGTVATVVSATDVAARRIPNVIVLPGLLAGVALLALASSLGGRRWPFAAAAIAMMALAVFYLALGLVFPGGMGLGDVKWAGVIGLYLAGSVGAKCGPGHSSPFSPPGGFLAMRRCVVARRSRAVLPMAPFMTVGALAALLAMR